MPSGLVSVSLIVRVFPALVFLLHETIPQGGPVAPTAFAFRLVTNPTLVPMPRYTSAMYFVEMIALVVLVVALRANAVYWLSKEDLIQEDVAPEFDDEE